MAAHTQPLHQDWFWLGLVTRLAVLLLHTPCRTTRSVLCEIPAGLAELPCNAQQQKHRQKTICFISMVAPKRRAVRCSKYHSAPSPACTAPAVSGKSLHLSAAAAPPLRPWPNLQVDNYYTITSAAWKPDGSKLSLGTLTGAVDLYDACVKRHKCVPLLQLPASCPAWLQPVRTGVSLPAQWGATVLHAIS
jgi:hypothetical protein